jgi:hypothetical protein
MSAKPPPPPPVPRPAHMVAAAIGSAEQSSPAGDGYAAASPSPAAVAAAAGAGAATAIVLAEAQQADRDDGCVTSPHCRAAPLGPATLQNAQCSPGGTCGRPPEGVPPQSPAGLSLQRPPSIRRQEAATSTATAIGFGETAVAGASFGQKHHVAREGRVLRAVLVRRGGFCSVCGRPGVVADAVECTAALCPGCSVAAARAPEAEAALLPGGVAAAGKPPPPPFDAREALRLLSEQANVVAGHVLLDGVAGAYRPASFGAVRCDLRGLPVVWARPPFADSALTNDPDSIRGAAVLIWRSQGAPTGCTYHLRVISMASEILDWLRITYVFESWYP